MASRVRKFQNLQDTEEHVQPLSIPSSAEQLSPEPGVTFGHGRRADSSFGSPAARTSRDGTAGIKGDGRPPIGDADIKACPGSINRPGSSQPQSTTPVLSLALKSRCDIDPFSAYDGSVRPLRNPNSAERTPEPGFELANARLRLRSIAEIPKTAGLTSKDQPYTMCELGTMLDNAIEGTTDSGATEDQNQPSREATPNMTFTRRQSLASTPHKSPSNIPGAFSPAKDLSYNGAATSASPSKSAFQISLGKMREDALHQPSPTRSARTVSKLESTALQHNEASLAMAQSGNSVRGESPVKQKTAMFEELEQERSSETSNAEHAAHLHVKDEWCAIPTHMLTKERGKEVHDLRFGRTVYGCYERPQLPNPRAQAKEQVPESKNRSTRIIETFDPALHPPRPSREGGNRRPSSKASRAKRERKSSLSWLSRWKLFGKEHAASAHEKETEAIATSEQGEHNEPPCVGTVKSRVQSILDATRKREENDQDKIPSAANYLDQCLSRKPDRVTPHRSENTVPSPKALESQQIALSQSSFEGEAFAPSTTADCSSLMKPDRRNSKIEATSTLSQFIPTPVRHSWQEKKALPRTTVESKTAPGQPLSVRSISPIKTVAESQPCTPPRGRCALVKDSLPRGTTHSIEQRYILNSSSRSRSRADSSQIKLELELQDSPEREAREKGDKLLILRANVASVDSL